MLQSELEALEKGEQVRYTGNWGSGSWPATGTIITRKPEWLDDEHSVKFTWKDEDGREDWHFFAADELEFIKE